MSSRANNPKISILIANKDSFDLLHTCVESILELTTYDNYEIVIIENNSTDERTLNYYKQLEKTGRVRVLCYESDVFNYPKVINYAVEQCESDYILQLNNDMKLLTPGWLELMLDVLEKDETAGAVGVKLYYPDKSIQHIGGTLYMQKGLVCEHIYRFLPFVEQHKYELLTKVRRVAWVTGACIMTSRSLYNQIGGLDEGYDFAANDPDLCMKIRAQGKHCIIHPFVELIHFESKTQGYDITAAKYRKLKAAEDRFVSKWRDMISDKDPYDVNDEYRIAGGFLFSVQRVLYKILPLQLYIYFHKVGAKLHSRKHKNANS